ncbi:MAG: SGNH/GDSL hydrolase family protein [Chthoniobacteraceae bacterium]
MHSRRIILATAITALLAFAPATFAETKAPAAPSEFKKIYDKVELKDGDSFVFLGDSITHQCLYTQYVEDYFYTRMPKVRIHFHNAGVGGDRAKDALNRFDDDVAAFKPKYVTILLGMNDGAYRGFDQQTFDNYQADMTALLDKIAALGATAIPMTPTMFDSRAKKLKGDNTEPRNTYYNGVLSLYGSWLREQAQNRGLGFVDMWSPLNNLTLEKRKQDANWTMIGDAVHPGPVGQTVMAAAIINDVVPKTVVSQTTIIADAAKPTATAANAKVSDLKVAGGKVTFTLMENSLPWVLPPDTAEGQTLTHIGHRNGNEKLTVRQLPAGKYELKIDGAPVGQFTDGQLSVGVELEGNDKTPQYQQALKVALLNKERNEKVYQKIRGLYSQLKGKRNALAKLDANAPAAAAKKEEFAKWHADQKSQVAALLADARKIEDQIYVENQPKPHSYELTKL